MSKGSELWKEMQEKSKKYVKEAHVVNIRKYYISLFQKIEDRRRLGIKNKQRLILFFPRLVLSLHHK